MRTAAAVIAGYLFFSMATFVLFVVSGHEPHDPVSVEFAVVATVYGVVAAFIGGLIAMAIARRSDLRANLLIAALIAIVALITMLNSPVGGSRWSMVSAIVLMAPATLLGGWFYQRLASSTT